jgi:hypothetical protein
MLDERPSIFIRDKPVFSSERTMTTRVQLKKKSLVMSLKGLGTRTK